MRAWMLAALLFVVGAAAAQGSCPLTVGVANNGAIFTSRFYGWYRTSPKVLADVLAAGCYPEAGPRPISAVVLAAAPGAKVGRVHEVLAIFERSGVRSKVTLVDWKNAPRRPVEVRDVNAPPGTAHQH